MGLEKLGDVKFILTKESKPSVISDTFYLHTIWRIIKTLSF